MSELRYHTPLVVDQYFFKKHIFKTAEELSIFSKIKEFNTPI